MPEEDIEDRANTCRLALKAALEAITDYCGLAPAGEMENAFGEAFAPHTIEIKGIVISVPEEIEEILHSNPDLTRDERITAIQESSWAQHEAEGLCEKLFGATGSEFDECVERVSRKLAEGMVG